MLTLLAVTSLGAAQPSNCRFYMVDQLDWGRKLGFYLDFEGARLETLPLILGVADGENWRFLTHAPGFVPDREYHIKAIVAPDRAELWLDGQQVGTSPGGWKPAPVSLAVNFRPSWAAERGDWLAIISWLSVMVQRGGLVAEKKDFDFSQVAARPVPLQLVEEGEPTYGPLDTRAGDTVTVEVSLRFGVADLRKYAPFIDQYGQYRYADYPEKVHSDEELRQDIAHEDELLAQMPPSQAHDAYGGYLGAWHEQATGFFRVVRREGTWWLVSPLGNPCFYTGVSSVPAQTWETTPVTDREFLFEWLPPKQGAYRAAWSANCWGENQGTEYACLYTCNLIRKYGEDRWAQAAAERATRRLRAWGFGCGKWGAPPEEVSTPVLGLGATPRLAGHPDVFDEAVCATMRRELERQIFPHRADPRILGWSVGNEYDELITPAEVREILAKPPETPARRALVDYALDTIYGGDLVRLAEAWGIQAADRAALHASKPQVPDADIETLRRLYESKYYETLYRTIKNLDPNHLYLGNWIVPGWWVNEEDWRIVARYCDVIGYDRYSRSYHDELLMRLERETDKPVLCGEFSLPAWYGGLRGFGRYHAWARDETEAGELYYGWVEQAARDPYCVGLIWFLYRDQPLTGRGPGRGPSLVHGEHFAFGLITETDRAKWPLVRRMREANLAAARWRAGGSGGHGRGVERERMCDALTRWALDIRAVTV